MGMVFLFDRQTGKPVFPIEERPVPKSDLAGEETSPTQPFPVRPAPFSRQHFSDSDITTISVAAFDSVKAKIGNALMGTIYTPPSTRGVVEFPGTRGGAEWGGASFDPATGILYVNANETPLLIKMKSIPAEDAGDEAGTSAGEKIYTLNNCTMCHGADRMGSGVFPSLKNISARLSEGQVAAVLKTGRGQMPAFPNISGRDKAALLSFLFDKKDRKPKNSGSRKRQDTGAVEHRYVHNGWTPLVDPNGYPGVKPPWGTLNAIDLNKGELLWQVLLGEFPELTRAGHPLTGTPNLGGVVVTAGGLVMIAATKDEKFRIFDKENGRLLWEYKLPAGGYATPATYSVNGKQYIVIAAGGGGKVGSPSGDAYVAFGLGD
jgi:quinoprotein glucose dehydrogenase